MPKKHDGNSDLRSIGKIARIEFDQIKIPKNTLIGIRRWGRLDYLRHLGYSIVWVEPRSSSNVQPNEKQSARAAKKAAKEPKLTDKTKKKK